MAKPRKWNGWSATSWGGSALPIPTRWAMSTSDLLAMADSNARTSAESADDAAGQRAFPQLARRSNGLARENRESWLNRMMRAVFGWSPTSIRSDLKVLLDGAAAETGFSPDESRMLKSILSLRERRLDDLMVPRADIVAVQQDIPLGELVKLFESAPHSRLVVYNDTLDEPVGMVHIRDLIAFMTARATVQPEANTTRAEPSRDGLASIEDIVEEIVGDIEDEHDEATERGVVRQPDGSYLAVGRASLEEAVAVIGAEFDVGDAAEEVDTVGGYIVTLIGRVPVRGELLPGPGAFEIEIVDADPRRVKRVRIYPRKQAARAIERSPSRRPETTSRITASTVMPPPEKNEPSSVPGAEHNSPQTQVKSKP